MSYNKMIKWNKKHPKGTIQPVLMHTNSGFNPSGSFIQKWVKYAASFEANNLPYMSCEDYYYSLMK